MVFLLTMGNKSERYRHMQGGKGKQRALRKNDKVYIYIYESEWEEYLSHLRRNKIIASDLSHLKKKQQDHS